MYKCLLILLNLDEQHKQDTCYFFSRELSVTRGVTIKITDLMLKQAGIKPGVFQLEVDHSVSATNGNNGNKDKKKQI